MKSDGSGAIALQLSLSLSQANVGTDELSDIQRASSGTGNAASPTVAAEHIASERKMSWAFQHRRTSEPFPRPGSKRTQRPKRARLSGTVSLPQNPGDQDNDQDENGDPEPKRQNSHRAHIHHAVFLGFQITAT